MKCMYHIWILYLSQNNHFSSLREINQMLKTTPTMHINNCRIVCHEKRIVNDFQFSSIWKYFTMLPLQYVCFVWSALSLRVFSHIILLLWLIRLLLASSWMHNWLHYLPIACPAIHTMSGGVFHVFGITLSWDS